jgi:hypothetical protein
MRQTHGGTRGLRLRALGGLGAMLLAAAACGDDGGESVDDCPGDMFCPPPGTIVLDGGADGGTDGGDEDGGTDGGVGGSGGSALGETGALRRPE